jgi:hypothetical protein
MSCDCIDQVNRQLRTDGSRLMQITHANGERRVLLRRVLLHTDTHPYRLGLPPVVVATHCPFCGAKYED